jgi:hypothetical protein
MHPPTHSNQNKSQLIGLSYWSFSLGFGPLLPAVTAWIYRRDPFLAQQLIQSALFQGIFWLISTIFFILSLINLYNDPQSQGSPEGLVLMIASGIVGWTARILLFAVSVLVFSRGYIYLPGLHWLSNLVTNFGRRKTIKKAVALSLFWPGFGQMFLGKSWFGGILATCHFVTAFSFGYLLLAHLNLSFAKDLLGIMGFYWRVGDQAFAEGFATPLQLGLLGGLLLLNYVLALINLPIWFRLKNAHRRIFGSFGISYIVHIGILWVLVLMPFIFTSAQTREEINKRAQQIYQQLQKQKQERTEALKKPKPNLQKPKDSLERELKFDLSVPDQVKGINEFSAKPFSQKLSEQKETKPTIGFGEREQPLPPKRNYVKEQTRDSKSYSEYITAKIREGDKDRLIWQQAPKPYSTVIQYTVSGDGHVSDIRIVEPSGNLKIDSLVVSVVESMSPFIRPPGSKALKITELFWNTGGEDGLDTEMKRSLASYPDGRVIEQ